MGGMLSPDVMCPYEHVVHCTCACVLQLHAMPYADPIHACLRVVHWQTVMDCLSPDAVNMLVENEGMHAECFKCMQPDKHVFYI